MSAKLDRLREVLSQVLEEDQEFPVRRLQILLLISEKGPITSTEISESLGLFKARTGKHLQALAVSHNGEQGYGMIEIDFMGGDYRSKYAKLTPKGERFIKRLTEAL